MFDLITDLYFLQKEYRKSLEVYTEILTLRDQVREVWVKMTHIVSKVPTCFGISSGRPERIGELGYTAITLGGYMAKLEEFFLENLIYFSCELIICLAVSQPRMVRIPQSSIVQIRS